MNLEQCKKELEIAQQKAEQFDLLSAGMDQLPIPIHIVDRAFTVLYTNQAAADLLGRKKEELVGGKCFEQFQSENCNTPNCVCRVVMEKGISHHSEILRGDVVIDVTGFPMTDSTGTMIGAIEYFPDVTEEKKAVADILRVAKEAENGVLSTRTDPSLHTGDYQKMAVGINGILDAVIGPLNVAAEYIKKIGKGEIPEKITEQYNGDFNSIKDNLNNCIDNINRLVADANMLSVAALEGRLDARADETRHQGDYRKIIEGFNGTLSEFIRKLRIASDTIRKIGMGVIPDRITVQAYGEFNDLKNNINTCIDDLGGLIEANMVLERMAVNDHTKGMEGHYQGIFEEIKTHVNVVRDRVINIAVSIEQIGEGDLSAYEELHAVGRRSDQDRVVPGFVRTLEHLRALTEDAGMLTRAAIEGRLETRADISRHHGEYRTIVEGVNKTLDAVIGPLNVAAEYVDRISKGVIPEKITDQYNGDFNEIKNNLNNCIDNINALVADANMLSVAAVEGRLATRADATRHQGDFRKIIEGVNETLDAIIGPLNVAINYYERIGNGDIPEKSTKKMNGDLIGMQKSINNCIDHINALVADAVMLSNAAVEGKLATRADATKHLGDYRKIIEGVNQTLDAVIEPVREATRVAVEFAQYNFTARIDKNMKVAGDFIVVRDALDNIGIAISTAVKGISVQMTDLAASAEEANASVEEVVSGAQQVAGNTGKVSSNAELGNRGLEQVLKAMEDLSAAVEEVTASTESVATLATNANTISKDGAELARKAEQGMVGITRSTTEVDQIIGEIKSEMNEIGKIVGLISDLANQTNLLALNAAIEAARAGDAGRGFAVVAAEVKSLAQESRTSAESIADMIGGLQQKSELAAQATASASKEVGEGSAVLSETLNVFNRIVADVEKITRSVQEVASASEEQAATVEEITASVHEVGNLVDGTASEAGDAAAASEETSAAIDEVGKIIENVNVIVDKVSREISIFRV